MRTLRALWRDSSALWNEFRRPLLAFFISVFAGGWLYGELVYQTNGERVPYIDLPYWMIQLMSLQGIPEVRTPEEWYLMAFWYLMPIIGIYVVGRSALDFVRIFFNRGERRRAWEEAVASTYRNHIIVLGIGHVGSRVVRALVQMQFDVVAIDVKTPPERAEELQRQRVPLILGDGRLPATLESAGLPHAQSLIVCTSSDQLNLEVTMRARDMNPTIRIVVRSWDAAFAAQLKRFMGVEAVLSSSDLSAPAFAGAAVGIELAQTFTVHGQSYSLIRMQVSPTSKLRGKTIDYLQRKYNMDIVLHSRDTEAEVHPSDSIIVEEGDYLVLFARFSDITDIVAANR